MGNSEPAPAISVILPVYHGAAVLDRAIDSVVRQTFPDWEIAAVDDGSSDESYAVIERRAAQDCRIRPVRLEENRGVSAARNVAIQNARGTVVCYLDHDDEYYPDYLANVARLHGKADVLVFGYDFIYEDGPTGSRPPSWDPGRTRQFIFAQSIVTPLGVAHCRALWETVGGFNEMVSVNEDWDFWKRIARAGANFAFLPLKSGRYHVRADSASRMPHITPRQKERFLENWRKGRPIYDEGNCEAGISNLKSQILFGGGCAPVDPKRPHRPWVHGARPLPAGEGTGSRSHPGHLPVGERTGSSPRPNPPSEDEGTIASIRRDLECVNSFPLSTAIDVLLAQKQGEGLPLDFNKTNAAPRQGQSGNQLPHSKARKIAFVSPHCVLDFTNGAATATLDGLSLLARSGFECQAFCSSRLDSWEEVLVEEVLARRDVRYEVRNAQIGAHRARMIFTTHEKVPVTLFNSASTRGGWFNAEEIAAFLAACELFLTKNRPDVVWTYGGDPVSLAVQQLVKRLDIPILFALHNFAYRDTAAFQLVDYVIVPTEFCRQFYWDTLGLASLKLPLVVDPARVGVDRDIAHAVPECEGRKGSPHPSPLPVGEETTNSPHPNPLPKGEGTRGSRNPLPMRQGTVYVTFVNPEPRKGIHIFARIAEVLSQRRPDIPLLMVEGAGKARFLSKLGIDLSGVKNLRIMPNSPDARGFLAVTKMLLMPSLMENAGLAAIEAMLNGIPVLASNRGGLPETIGDAGFLLDIPAKYTPETRLAPTAEEVMPWVETIIRLWDDAAEYERWSQAARDRAQLWRPDRIADVYGDFFSNIAHQPGPPLVPQWLTWQATPPAMNVSAIVVSNRDQMIMRFPRNAVVAEIGVDEGAFSRSILRTDPKKLYLIDPWEKQAGDYAADPTNEGDFETKYRTVRDTLGRLPNVEIIRDYSLKAVERFPDRYFDWIYLDADHSYRAVMADLEGWIRKIRPGGIFAGHDYCAYQWIQVKPALDDFLFASGRRLEYLTSDDVYLSWGFIVTACDDGSVRQ